MVYMHILSLGRSRVYSLICDSHLGTVIPRVISPVVVFSSQVLDHDISIIWLIRSLLGGLSVAISLGDLVQQ